MIKGPFSTVADIMIKAIGTQMFRCGESCVRISE